MPVNGFVRVLRWTCILFLAASSACRLHPQFPELKDFQTVGAADSAKYLASLDEARKSLVSARGMFDIRLKKSVSSQQLHQVIAFELPDRLRLEFFASSLNQLVSITVARGGLLEHLDARENVLYRGPASQEQLTKIFGLPFAPNELMYWFAGRIPGLSSVTRVARSTNDARWLLEGEAGANRKLRAIFAGEPPRLQMLEIRNQADEPSFFSRHEYNEAGLPRTLKFQLLAQELEAELTGENFRENPGELSDRLFQVPVGPNVRVEWIGAAEAVRVRE